MVFAPAGDIGEQFAEVAPVEARAAKARGGDVGDGEAGVVGHGDEGLLAVARDALQPDLLGVHGGISLQVVEEAARAPGDRAEGAPVVRFTGLALVQQGDNAGGGEARAVVGLDAAGIERGVAPAAREELLLPVGVGGAGPIRPAQGRRRGGIGVEQAGERGPLGVAQQRGDAGERAIAGAGGLSLMPAISCVPFQTSCLT